MVEFGLLVALGALVPVALGALWRARGWAHGWALALVAAAAAIVAAVLGVHHDPNVSGGAVAGGVALAAVGVALPLSGYYALGRLVGNRLIVTGVWLVSLVPLGFYALFLALLVAAKLQCPPDAYECPI